MEVQFTPEQETLITQMAANTGRDAGQFVRDTALRALEEAMSFQAAVDAGIAEADRGDLIDDDEVKRWLDERRRFA